MSDTADARPATANVLSIVQLDYCDTKTGGGTGG